MKKIFKGKNAVYIIIIMVLSLFTFLKNDFTQNIKKTSYDNLNGNVNKEVLLDGNLQVHFLDVGQADCILIKDDSHNMLIDAGNNEDGEKVVSYLKDLNIDRFDYVVGTHPHEDHIGGMDDIINNFKIDTYFMPDKMSLTKTFEDVLDALNNNGLKYKTPSIADEFYLGRAKIKVIYAGDNTNDINDSSIILKLTYGKNTFLFSGDATSNVEKTLLAEDLKSDVLKVAHHGSNYCSTKEFLNKVNPIYAVIEVGRNNSYNHPSSSTIKKLNKLNTKIYRTDKDGSIIFISDGNTIKVKTKKTNTNG